ncbi:hypothetical protein [Thermomonospora umbrina]|uniref:hypothetical protein n=1 Tax=Thermomonospora umbrina TaxID=111806 RepID=UPI0011C12260|nr:hypothetical protein [Thermomonospora umbrina]
MRGPATRTARGAERLIVTDSATKVAPSAGRRTLREKDHLRGKGGIFDVPNTAVPKYIEIGPVPGRMSYPAASVPSRAKEAPS